MIDQQGKGVVVQCVLGLPGCFHMDDAARAIFLAENLSKNIHRVAGSLTCTIGVATGMAFCGPVGSPSRREFTIIGVVPQRAAGLMNKAGAGEILIDESTWESATEMSGNVKIDFVEREHELASLGTVRTRF